MSWYAQYYRESVHPTDETVKYTQCLGSFAIIRIDGRLTLDKAHEIAAYHCEKRRYHAYQLSRGNRLDELKEIDGLIKL